MTDQEITVQQALQDLKDLAADAEELINNMEGEIGESAKETRDKFQASLQSAKATCAKLEGKAVNGAKITDKFIREHPYESIGIGFGIGVLIGILLNRK